MASRFTGGVDINIEEILPDWRTNWILRDDFVFAESWSRGTQRRLDRLVIRNPARAGCRIRQDGYSVRTLEEHIALINELALTKVLCICEDISFLRHCPSVTDAVIYPAFGSPADFDYSPLYDLPQLRALTCSTACGSACDSRTVVDYARLPGLEKLHVGDDLGDRGHRGYEQLSRLRTLSVTGCKRHKRISDLCASPELRELSLLCCGLKSLDGLSRHPQLHTLHLSHCRALEDISALTEAAASLRTLIIDSCPRIRDFSALRQLSGLEVLALDGSNTLPDLQFLNDMPHLHFFRCTMDVADGDLTPCLRLPYAACRNRRHFNLRDEQLPKRLPEED